MKKISFDPDTEFYIVIKFKKSFNDPIARHTSAMRFIAKNLGCKSHEVIVVSYKVTALSLHIVFKKATIYDTSEGAPVELYSYCSRDGFDLKGSKKEGKVRLIEKRNEEWILWADCQASYHDPLCARFLTTKSIVTPPAFQYEN